MTRPAAIHARIESFQQLSVIVLIEHLEYSMQRNL